MEVSDGNIPKYFHGLYNMSVLVLFFYQGWLGLKIRAERLQGRPPTAKIIRRHRKRGPLLALMGIAGFLAGLGTVYLDKGRVFEHPLHFLNGTAIVASIAAIYFVSKEIRVRHPDWRNPHFALGILILCLYLIQAYLGLDLLL